MQRSARRPRPLIRWVDPARTWKTAAQGNDPDSNGILGEEDDTHINIRIPKASLKRKQSGMAGTV